MWQTIATITAAFIGGSAGSVITGWLQSSREKSKTNFLALQLAIYFENYVSKTINRLSQHELYLERDGGVGELLVEIPRAAALPESENYEQIDISITNRVFSFANYLQLSQADVNTCAELGIEKDEHYHNVFCGSVSCATYAMSLANDLRQKYSKNEGAFNHHEFDVAETLSRMERDISSNAKG